MRTIGTLAIMLLLSGCATQGRFTAIDIDFRKPDQITAGVKEMEAPFKDWTKADTAKAETVTTSAITPTWWEMLLDMIKDLECRVTIVKVEWRDTSVSK
jgi:hypothetical protein